MVLNIHVPEDVVLNLGVSGKRGFKPLNDLATWRTEQ